MAINLADVPGAVRTYLDTKVSVGISAFTPVTGAAINPGENFTFKVEVRNAIALAGGVVLTNVKYRMAVANSTVAKIQVPVGGTSTSLAGVPIAALTFVDGFIYSPASISDNFSLGIGDIDSLLLTGKAGTGGGTIAINARILADVDLNQLFLKGQDSTPDTRDLTVVG